jgi:hypothetical protein
MRFDVSHLPEVAFAEQLAIQAAGCSDFYRSLYYDAMGYTYPQYEAQFRAAQAKTNETWDNFQAVEAEESKRMYWYWVESQAVRSAQDFLAEQEAYLDALEERACR